MVTSGMKVEEDMYVGGEMSAHLKSGIIRGGGERPLTFSREY